jgi:hypothetical protein
VKRRRAVPYREREAYAEDALLLIEAAGYGVVDCGRQRVEVHRGLSPEGYRESARCRARGACRARRSRT